MIEIEDMMNVKGNDVTAKRKTKDWGMIEWHDYSSLESIEASLKYMHQWNDKTSSLSEPEYSRYATIRINIIVSGHWTE